MKYSAKVGRGQRKNQVDFGGDLDSSVDRGSFSGFLHHYEIGHTAVVATKSIYKATMKSPQTVHFAGTKNKHLCKKPSWHKNYVQSVADGDSWLFLIRLHWFDVRPTRNQGEMESITVTCFCHNSCYLPYVRFLLSSSFTKTLLLHASSVHR